jgi:hypothetical protein
MLLCPSEEPPEPLTFLLIFQKTRNVIPAPAFTYSRNHSKIFPVRVMNAYGGMEVQLRSFLTSAIEADEWSSRSGHFIPGKELRHPRSVWLGGHRSQSGRFGGDNISFPCRELNRYSSVRPVSKSLFGLSYPNSWK